MGQAHDEAETRRQHGAPAQGADDLLVRELALACQIAWGLGPQKARDLALSILEGRLGWPTKLPRGIRKTMARSKLTGSWLTTGTIKGREGAIAKGRRGDRVRPGVVKAWIDVLRAGDDDLVRSLKALVSALLSSEIND